MAAWMGKSEGRYFSNLKLAGWFSQIVEAPNTSVSACLMFCVPEELPRWFLERKKKGNWKEPGISVWFNLLSGQRWTMGRKQIPNPITIPHTVGDSIRALEVCLDTHCQWMEAVSYLGRRKEKGQDVCYPEWESGWRAPRRCSK